jgi:FixJ family two-component response regulator
VQTALENDLKKYAAENEQKSIMKRFENLTAREYEVMTYVTSGMLNKQIAAALNISEKTVKVHRARVYKKAGVDSLAQLVRYTERVGIKPVNLSN